MEAQSRAAGKEGTVEDVRTQVELIRRAQEAEDFVAALDARIEQIGSKGGQKMAEQVQQNLQQQGGAQAVGLPDKEQAAAELRALKDEAKRQAAEDKKALHDEAKQQADAERAVPAKHADGTNANGSRASRLASIFERVTHWCE